MCAVHLEIKLLTNVSCMHHVCIMYVILFISASYLTLLVVGFFFLLVTCFICGIIEVDVKYPLNI